jgi:hypothetical protein
VTAVRDAAVYEIAKLSISSTINLDDPFPVQSTTVSNSLLLLAAA